jgi:hypothetical protein
MFFSDGVWTTTLRRRGLHFCRLLAADVDPVSYMPNTILQPLRPRLTELVDIILPDGRLIQYRNMPERVSGVS